MDLHTASKDSEEDRAHGAEHSSDADRLPPQGSSGPSMCEDVARDAAGANEDADDYHRNSLTWEGHTGL